MNKEILSSILLVAALSLLVNTVNAQSDFYLEAKVNAAGTAPINTPLRYSGPDLNITKFEIQGNSESYKEICPSLQCKIDYKDKYTYFSPPDIPESTLIISNVDFKLQDNITHADLGPKKKELVEQYSANIYCNVDDIVEKNGQELYYCHNANLNSIISNKFDGRSWVFDNTGIYDAKNNTLRVIGNLTDKSASLSATTGNLTENSPSLWNTTKLTEGSSALLDTTNATKNENDNVGNPYFSIKIPDSWAYTEGSNTPEAKNTGFGPVNSN